MARKLKVYIAGPLFTSGKIDRNIRDAIDMGYKVKEAGALPFVPHLYFFWDMMVPHPREFWMELDEMWVKECDATFRLPGESDGADQEVKWTKEMGHPVFTEARELFDYIQRWNKATGQTDAR